VSALAGFLSTWSEANATFGRGAPAQRARFDQSGGLLDLRDRVASAAPGTAWAGSGADQYAVSNVKHANTLGALGSLDNRLGTEIDHSAAVVAAGRRDLDAVRKWVVDAAATPPNTLAGQRVLYPVLRKGAKDIHDILARSHGEMADIADRIRGIGAEYDELAGECQVRPRSAATTFGPRTPTTRPG
jgi:EspA-like secreted protein